MSLGPGSSLGPFKIQSLLGKGGMGEVFSAVDTRLDRRVALKILPPAFANDTDRLRRFQSEARTLASLNHPNILSIFEVGTDSAQPYLVSELLEGRTLREELNSKPLPVRKALDYALQIATGLAAAHARGIVHRDLKPENIFLIKDGRIKLLDFGLAKPGSASIPAGKPLDLNPGPDAAAAGDAPTLIQSTIPGLILGTPAYMSPEQVRGEPADHRSDIFAFGCVLYEMASGKGPFHKATAAESMTAILKEEPPELPDPPSDQSPFLRHLILRCLEKLPERRFQSASDLAFALQSLTNASTAQTARTLADRPRPALIRWALAGAVVLLFTILAFFAGRSSTSSQTPAASPPITWRGERFDGPAIAFTPRLSPDGKELAFTIMVDGQSQLGLMFIETGDWKVLTTNRSRGLLQNISWSPDGSHLFYDRFSARPMGVFRISKYGGEERLLLEEGACPRALPDGTLILERREHLGERVIDRLYYYNPQSEELRPLNGVTPLSGMTSPLLVTADGKSVVFRGRTTNDLVSPPNFWRIDLASSQVSLLSSNLDRQFNFREIYPFAVSRNSRQFIFDHPSDNLHRLFSVNMDGSGRARPLVTLTGIPITVELDHEDNLFVDQTERPSEILRRGSSGVVDRFPLGPYWENRDILPLPGNRFLFSGEYREKKRLMVWDGGEERSFLDPKVESDWPVSLLGSEHVLFGVHQSNQLVLASASLDGRALRRIPAVTWSLPITESGTVSVAGSPDGGTIYYSRDGAIFSIAASGGASQKLCKGHSVAVSPDGRYLVVKVNALPSPHLVRFDLTDRSEQPIDHPKNLPLIAGAIAPNAISRDGKIAVIVAPLDIWYWPAAILDPKSGEMEVIRDPLADMYTAGWDAEGRFVASAMFFRSSIWRFRPEK